MTTDRLHYHARRNASRRLKRVTRGQVVSLGYLDSAKREPNEAAVSGEGDKLDHLPNTTAAARSP